MEPRGTPASQACREWLVRRDVWENEACQDRRGRQEKTAILALEALPGATVLLALKARRARPEAEDPQASLDDTGLPDRPGRRVLPDLPVKAWLTTLLLLLQ